MDGWMHTRTDEGHFYSPPPPTSGDKKEFNAECVWGDLMMQAYFIAHTGLQIPTLHEMCRET